MKHNTLCLIFFILVVGSILFLNCQQKSESEQQTANQTDLMQAMDAYHRVMRPLMHQALPEKDVTAFKDHAGDLLNKAEKLVEAEIPEKFSEEKTRIDSLRREILTKTQTFGKAAKSGSDNEIFDAFMTAHDEYERLADLVYKL